MKDKLIKVANELSDLAAAYEEKITQKLWVTDGWKDLMQRLCEYDEEFQFPDDSDPTEVVHELFLRIQNLEGRNPKYPKKATRYFDWPNPIPEAAPLEVRQVQADAALQQARFEIDAAMWNVNPFVGRPLVQAEEDMRGAGQADNPFA